MGIPRFFYWLYHNHSQCLLPLKEAETVISKNILIDSYALDLNAIIHPVCQKMYNYGNNVKNPRFLHRSKLPVNEKQVFAEICKTIDTLRKIVNPQKQLIIAIDGTAGLSKQTQQRQRRFKSAAERGDRIQGMFDSNKITTGSKFMYDLSRYIYFYVQKQLESNPEWQRLEIIFSNEKVVGEGEHKIIRYINQNKKLSYCIHSPDADLIMLTIGLDIPHVYILRENIYKDIEYKYFLVEVSTFRNEIVKTLSFSGCNELYVIYDFILICFLLGNDFLPHIPSLEISNSGLEILFNLYPKLNTHLVYRSKEGEICLNTKGLYSLFFHLSKLEKELLTNKASQKIQFPDKLLSSHINQKIGKDNEMQNVLNFTKYREEYYTQKFKPANIHLICNEYFKGLLFVIRYYIDEIPDWHWSYNFHYAPFFTDMVEHIEKFNGCTKFQKNSPLSPIEQLMAVLPPQSANILPECCQHLLTSSESPIIDFYPLNFKIDLEGKNQEWEGHPILPFIDVERIQQAYKLIEDKLSPEEKQRAQEGNSIKYFYYNSKVIYQILK